MILSYFVSQIEYVGAWIRGVLVRVWMLWLCAREEQLLHLLVSSDNVLLHQWAWLDWDLCSELVVAFQGRGKKKLLNFSKNKYNFHGKSQGKWFEKKIETSVASRKKRKLLLSKRRKRGDRLEGFFLFIILLLFEKKIFSDGICYSVIVRFQFFSFWTFFFSYKVRFCIIFLRRLCVSWKMFN